MAGQKRNNRSRIESQNIAKWIGRLSTSQSSQPRCNYFNNFFFFSFFGYFQERHVDLLCWMALSSRVLRQIAEYASDTAFMPEIEEDMTLYNNVENLDKWHWSETKKRYFDYGLHSENVMLKEIKTRDKDGQIHVTRKRDVKSPPKLQLVDNVFGYLNLFPFLLRLLPSSSDKLGIILNNLKTEVSNYYLYAPVTLFLGALDIIRVTIPFSEISILHALQYSA